jgi:hypothetical protein
VLLAMMCLGLLAALIAIQVAAAKAVPSNTDASILNALAALDRRVNESLAASESNRALIKAEDNSTA